jgi:hypothetical protein
MFLIAFSFFFNIGNRIVEHRRSVVDLFDNTSLIGRIHSLTDSFGANTYRDNPDNEIAVDLTLSRTMTTDSNSGGRRFR